MPLVGIAPGPFLAKGAWGRLPPRPEMAGHFEKRVPLGRPGQRAGLANIAAYLVSDRAAYVSGDCASIDGGRWLLGAWNFPLLAELTEGESEAVRSQGRKG